MLIITTLIVNVTLKYFLESFDTFSQIGEITNFWVMNFIFDMCQKWFEIIASEYGQ